MCVCVYVCMRVRVSNIGLIARELNTGTGVALGLLCNGTTGTLQLAAWQDTLHLLHAVPFPTLNASAGRASEGRSAVGAGEQQQRYHSIRLRIDIELVLAQVWWSVGDGPWQALPAFHKGSFVLDCK